MLKSARAIASILAASVPSANAQTTPGTLIALQCERAFDAIAGKLLGATTIVIENARIKSVDAGRIAPAGAQVIDLSGRTCLPGLIDMHTHITGETSPRNYEEGFRLNPADYALRGVSYADRTLLAGFTTVRNLGDGGNVSIALRNAIDQGYVHGPRIFTAGKSIATTGGHADPSDGRNIEFSSDPGPTDGVINGVDDARKAVRQRYKDGADLIKITSTGGVLSYAKNGQNPQFTVEEIKAITTTARDYGFRVAAHAHGDEGIQRAILGGVDSIEHGTFMSDKTMTMMKESGTWYVPTISAGAFVADKARTPGYYPEIIRPKALAVGPQIQATFARAWKAGVKIAFGTDAAVYPHGGNAHEFVLMTEVGMPTAAALQSATVRAAELLDQSKDLGTLDAGKFADIVAVNGNPLEQIATMEVVDFVMKNGTVYKQDGLRATR
ncbi:MAG: amidohydrolase family protein [Dokdonella sp.]